MDFREHLQKSTIISFTTEHGFPVKNEKINSFRDSKMKERILLSWFLGRIHLLWLIQSVIEMQDKPFLNLHDSLNIAYW